MVPVLERNPDAIMLINEFILPAWKEPGWEDPLDERPAREMDISMMAFLAAKERDLKMWKELFKQADERFEVTSMVREKKGMFPMGLLEVKLVR